MYGSWRGRDSYANPRHESDNEPYTVEDPDGNPIPLDTSESESARDTGCSARTQPEHEENGQRGREWGSTMPGHHYTRQHRMRDDSLDDPYRGDDFYSSSSSDEYGSYSDSTLSDDDFGGSKYSFGSSHQGFDNGGAQSQIPNRMHSPFRRRRSPPVTHVRFAEGSDVHHPEDSDPFARDEFAARRRYEQQFQYPGTTPDDCEDARAHGSHAPYNRRGRSRNDYTQPPPQRSSTYPAHGLHVDCGCYEGHGDCKIHGVHEGRTGSNRVHVEYRYSERAGVYGSNVGSHRYGYPSMSRAYDY